MYVRYRSMFSDITVTYNTAFNMQIISLTKKKKLKKKTRERERRRGCCCDWFGLFLYTITFSS